MRHHIETHAAAMLALPPIGLHGRSVRGSPMRGPSIYDASSILKPPITGSPFRAGISRAWFRVTAPANRANRAKRQSHSAIGIGIGFGVDIGIPKIVLTL